MSAVFQTVDTDAIRIDPREFAQRLGQSADTLPDGLACECEALLRPVLSYRYCCRRTAILRPEPEVFDFGFGAFRSHSLTRNLDGCKEAILFAATIGPGVDRLLARLAVTSPARRYVTDALASAAVESLCDYANARLSEGLSCAPRFSPGYGDVPLSVQPGFLQFVNAGRLLGITLSEHFFMNPSKSVTAIIGIRTD